MALPPHMLKRPAPGAAPKAAPAPAPKPPAAPQVAQTPQAPAPTGRPAFAAFGKIGGVSGPNAGGNYFKDGRYYVLLNKITAANSKNPTGGAMGGEYAAAEFTVLQHITEYEGSNKIGERVSSVYMFTKHGDIALSNFKGLLGACIGLNPDIKTPGVAGYATDEEWTGACYSATDGDGTSLAGTVLDVTAITTTTKAGKPFTKLMFLGVDDETAAALMGAQQAAE